MMSLNNKHLFCVVVGLTLGVSAPLFAQSVSPSPPKADKAQDEAAQEHTEKGIADQVQNTLKACFQCHGAGAVSQIPTRPTLAGQKFEYIRRQLKAFKIAALNSPETVEGGGKPRAVQRTDPVMEHMVAGVPESLIDPLARTLSNMACDGGAAKEPRPKPMSLPPSAEACTACHGADGISTQSQVPNLAGQHRAYLRRQLLLIRETAWGAEPREGEAWRSHPIMESQTARIAIADIDAIAKYYAELDCRGGGGRGGDVGTRVKPAHDG